MPTNLLYVWLTVFKCRIPTSRHKPFATSCGVPPSSYVFGAAILATVIDVVASLLH